MTATHPDSGKYICPECGEHFATPEIVEVHMGTIHYSLAPAPAGDERQAIATALGYSQPYLKHEIADIIAVEELLKKARLETAKAYGGCEKCFGKGYATYNNMWAANDTDQDIGTPGGLSHGGGVEMRYCTCPRGKQLKELTQKR